MQLGNILEKDYRVHFNPQKIKADSPTCISALCTMKISADSFTCLSALGIIEDYCKINPDFT